MPVTDDQVAALRAFLSDDIDLHRRLFADLDRAGAKKGCTALITAAFAEAVQRRWASCPRPADVVTFIDALRACSARVAEAVDPEIAEWLIRVVYQDVPTRGNFARAAIMSAQVLLLAGLIADARLDPADLDEFLAAARKLADQLMSRSESQRCR